jgi:hypothetical protein
MARVSSLYKYYDYADIAAHPALLYLPYTKSTMSFFEWCGSPVCRRVLTGTHGTHGYSQPRVLTVLTGTRCLGYSASTREYSRGCPKVLTVLRQVLDGRSDLHGESCDAHGARERRQADDVVRA